MPTTPPIPVIIGVGDAINRFPTPTTALEPLTLILRATTAALHDTAATSPSALSASLDSIDIVRTWTWPYDDLPSLLATHLHASPRRKLYTRDHGGHQPARLVDEAARRIAAGRSSLCLVAGGETLASLTGLAKAGRLPPRGWTATTQQVDDVFSATAAARGGDGEGVGGVHGVGAPIHVYPMYENGFRARRGQGVGENHKESAGLYARFAEVAGGNEYAWGFGRAESEESTGRVGGRNRMICFPYPLLMNAFNTVDLAAAVILTSTDMARRMGVPEHKWIYPLGGAGTRDSSDFWDRPNFWSSPSISASLDAGLAVSGLQKEQIDLYDFYSCFPIVPKLACDHLNMPILNPPKPITLLGGLTSFGGAGNNYSMHAITAMTRRLRDGGKETNGLVLANGGCVTYQHVLCLSSNPRKTAYPASNPLPEVLADEEAPEVLAQVPEGESHAVIETYTVEFGRDNKPLRGTIVGRLEDGKRFVANHGDEKALRGLSSFEKEQIGRAVVVWRDQRTKGRNLFRYKEDDGNARL